MLKQTNFQLMLVEIFACAGKSNLIQMNKQPWGHAIFSLD